MHTLFSHMHTFMQYVYDTSCGLEEDGNNTVLVYKIDSLHYAAHYFDNNERNRIKSKGTKRKNERNFDKRINNIRKSEYNKQDVVFYTLHFL